MEVNKVHLYWYQWEEKKRKRRKRNKKLPEYGNEGTFACLTIQMSVTLIYLV